MSNGIISPPAPRRREVIAWAFYDCANSAYSTLSITILAAYIQKVLLPGKMGAVVWAWGIAASMLTAAFLSPLLGALADAQRNKHRWLAFTAVSGSASAVLMALVPPNWPWVVVALFIATALMFELSLGFYNGFLPELADERTMNRLSAWGFAAGYLGGAIALLVAIGAGMLYQSPAASLRAGLLVMGAWWGLFSLPAIFLLRDRGQPAAVSGGLVASAVAAAREVGRTLARIRRYSMLALFLLAFLLYNDGIQTVISQSATFALQKLNFETKELIGLILLVQLVALPGAVAVGWLADRLGQKRVLLGCLLVWIGLVVWAWLMPQGDKRAFWAMGTILALVMGGTQSVSRAIMGTMTPPRRTAEFFGFFNLSGKATSFLGTFVFGLVTLVQDDFGVAVLSLLPFFVTGWLLVLRVSVARGRQQALAEE